MTGFAQTCRACISHRLTLLAVGLALSACSLERHDTSSFTWRGTVGGAVSGLTGTALVLQENGVNLSINTTGNFTFGTGLASGAAYHVAVLTQPNSPAQTCTVMNGSGTILNSNITNVQVNCITNRYTVGGMVSGLRGSGLVLQDNSGDNFPVSTNGSFTFKSAIPSGLGYSVTVMTQPSSPTQTCTITNGSGTVTNANITGIQVACVTNTYTVGGTVSGLIGSGLILQDDGVDHLLIAANGSFTFNNTIASGATYSVTVGTSPSSPNQTCTVANGSGTVVSAAITNVQVNCITNTYLFFKNPLSAVDPANPTAPITIEAAGTTANITAIEHATYRPAPSYTLNDRHYDTIVYRRIATGTFWKVSALTGGSLTPAQVSNEAAATVCTTRGEPDYADPNNAELVYSLPGADGTCGTADDVWRMVKVGMSATDAPYPAFHPLAAMRDPATGAINGWLAVNGSNLNAYDANFGNPTLVSAFTSMPSVLATAPDGHIVLFMDNQLRVYDPQATPPSLSSSLGTVTSLGTRRRDATDLFFDDGAALYKLPLDGSAAVSLVQTGAASASLLSLTTNYMIYWDGSSVMSVPKSGGSPVTFATAGSDSIETIGASGNKYYFHLYHACGGSWCSTAHVIDEDGTNDTAIADAAWFGWTEPTTVSFGAIYHDLPMDRVLLRNVFAAPFTLTSYDGASGTALATLGALPAVMDTEYDPYFMRLPNGGNLLGYSYASDSGTNDIVFANTDTSISLVRVTNSGSNETFVGAGGCTISAQADVDPTFLLALWVAFAWLVRHRHRRNA
ncbi:MAG: hypothetical protein ACYC9J_06755 [Sulfuricaulis sp.]